MILAPLERMAITSPYGTRIHPVTHAKSFHNGVDLRGREGTPIYAPVAGTVAINHHPTGGNQIILVCPEGLRFGFAHLSHYAAGLETGSVVRQGDLLGFIGSSGRVTGPHLHMTVSVRDGANWTKVDPELIPFTAKA